ncbi:uncharacterized protein LOC111401034 [Olea europaea var. sylvestris]|uniref:uncharacterized protein LOC111401034 n=1 Tax=Olea europaea var. sylvestris TaxID=158386 RepID=UPI000C1D21C3|nr:uncharacterized protein LOC111401034 [Olea europaea var. sylvestris]XP_022884336.1 uncharacterized protein LOC111401034 [Olea europaea var. sylvestris]
MKTQSFGILPATPFSYYNQPFHSFRSSSSHSPYLSLFEKKRQKQMIKSRFYRLEHGDRDASSDDYSSSSVSKVEADETEDEEENEVAEVRKDNEASSSSGYEREGSSVNENLDSLVMRIIQLEITQIITESHPNGEGNSEPVNNEHGNKKDEIPLDAADCILKLKSVFKCRLCPRIVCLSEETLKAHLTSKASIHLVCILFLMQYLIIFIMHLPYELCIYGDCWRIHTSAHD